VRPLVTDLHHDEWTPIDLPRQTVASRLSRHQAQLTHPRPTHGARPFDGNDRAGPDGNPLVAIRRATDRTSGQRGDADALPHLADGREEMKHTPRALQSRF